MISFISYDLLQIEPQHGTPAGPLGFCPVNLFLDTVAICPCIYMSRSACVLKTGGHPFCACFCCIYEK